MRVFPWLILVACAAPSVPLAESEQALTRSLTIQRGTGGVADATISAVQMTKNAGATAKLVVSKHDEALLRFDVSAIPANAVIESAALTLYLHGSEDDDG